MVVCRFLLFLGLPPRGKVAPQGRMRGRVCDYIPFTGYKTNLPLISQWSGPLTASPEGEAFSFLLCARLAALDD